MTLILLEKKHFLIKTNYISSGKDAKVKGLAAPSNLSMNQSLEGHSGKLSVNELEKSRLYSLSSSY